MGQWFNGRVPQWSHIFGLIAQLVERFYGIEEVRGSNPLGSTLKCGIKKFRGLRVRAFSGPQFNIAIAFNLLYTAISSPWKLLKFSGERKCCSQRIPQIHTISSQIESFCFVFKTETDTLFSIKLGILRVR
jgi:hypothetical protein